MNVKAGNKCLDRIARIIKCPCCQVKYKALIPTNLLDEDDDGIGVVLVEPACGHKFIIFVDKRLRVRGYERIEYENIEIRDADAAFIEQNIQELKKQHEIMLKEDYNKAFEILKEIKKARKNISTLNHEK
ncbi:hypothetical protein GF325_07465 [Candidatus Bathyarchaeota archaeon]|nr:hypothetical protein [Candidatus Bathyarchaeota archaeon]